jgi:hypothetical protein
VFHKWVKPAVERAVPLPFIIDGVITGTLPLRCPTCPRYVPLRQETARRLLTTLAAAGVDTFDLSSIK